MNQFLFRYGKPCIITVFLLLATFQNFAQYDFSKLDKSIEEQKGKFGGNITTLIYKDGKIIYKKETGDFNAATPAFIASCSKWLTAALVMTFIDEGKLFLNDKVSKYIPEFTDYGKGYITIRNCLSHTTGIEADKPGLMSIIKLSKYKTLEDEVNDVMKKHELFAQPGQQFFYSSVGLNIAGRVLEIISKKTFDQLMTQKIFRPLNMKNSTFSSEKAVNPSGGAKSTANDYMNFLIMILNKGTFNGKRILSEQSITEMQKAQTSLQMIKYAPPVAEEYNYALGEWIEETDDTGNATCVTSPGLFGTWPLIDLKRNYACIFFVKTLLSEQRKESYLIFKKVIDEQLQPK